VGNVSTNVYAKFRCALLCIKKALGIFRELITTIRRTATRAAFWDTHSGSKKFCVEYWSQIHINSYQPEQCYIYWWHTDLRHQEVEVINVTNIYQDTSTSPYLPLS